MDTAMRVLRAACLAGLALGLVVALAASTRDDASAEPLPVVVTTTTAEGPATLGQAAVGLTGPIGAGVDGTTATGRVGWRLPSLPSLPDADVALRLVLGTIAAGCLVVVAAVRI